MTTASLTRDEAKQSPQEKKSRSKLPLGAEELKKLDTYWRAANYLSVGQISLYDNPLLKEPLTKAHIKPRLLGHWGTTPGLNFIYAHLNRVIKKARSRHDLHSPGRAMAGRVWWPTPIWRGSTARLYPNISQDEGGYEEAVQTVFISRWHPEPCRARDTRLDPRRWGTWLRRSPMPTAPPSIIPDLIVACVVGDGEAETGPFGNELALEQIFKPAYRRSGSSHLAP